MFTKVNFTNVAIVRFQVAPGIAEDRPTMCFPIYLNSKKALRVPEMEYSKIKDKYINIEQPENDEQIIWPVRDDGSMGRWYKGVSTIHAMEKELKAVKQNNNLYYVYYRRRPNEGVQPTTFWSESKYSATEHGTALLKKLFQEHEPFSYPKSIHAVVDCLKAAGANEPNSVILDYFAGSGTTGHATINLNREDNGSRKYILIEMGQYFNTVLKPRIQKVIYSKDWKDGKPKPDKDGSLNGISHCFKYLRLESYEDTLNNLIVKKPTSKQQSILEINPELKEDYMLSYCLDMETKDSASLLNLDQFENPFTYQLNISTDSVGVTKPTRIDLVETFNYLLGLTVRQIKTIDNFKLVIGENPKEETVLVVWRVLAEKDNAALESFMKEQSYHPKDTKFEHIYVNGDHTLEDPHSKVKMIEIEFKRLMFDVQDA